MKSLKESVANLITKNQYKAMQEEIKHLRETKLQLKESIESIRNKNIMLVTENELLKLKLKKSLDLNVVLNSKLKLEYNSNIKKMFPETIKRDIILNMIYEEMYPAKEKKEIANYKAEVKAKEDKENGKVVIQKNLYMCEKCALKTIRESTSYADEIKVELEIE